MKDKLTRASLLAAELSEFLGWHILFHCPSCGRSSDVTIDSLVNRYGFYVEVYTVVRKLKCDACTVAPDSVHLFHFGPIYPRSPHHVQLWGDGMY
jgi:hypothetical protein